MRNVLVVDDDAVARRVVTNMLRIEGHTVETAGDGLEALAKVEKQRPDAIVLDLVMPGMDGWTFLKRCGVTPGCRGIPIVLLSANHELARSAQAALRYLGVREVVLKPFERTDLLAALQRTLPNLKA